MINPPRCVEFMAYREWLVLRRMAREDVHFCNDCTPEYALQMRACSRCDHPEVRFHRVDSGWEGVFPVSGDLF